MSSWIAAGFLVAGFALFVKLFGLIGNSRKVIAVSRRSLKIVRTVSLDDNAKEVLLQACSLQLLWMAILIALGTTAAIAAPLAILWACEQLGLISLRSVGQVTVSPVFLISSTIAILIPLGYSLRRRTPRDFKPSDMAKNYPALDRILHRIAFQTPSAQLAIADIEDRLFAKPLARCTAERPVFITGLPRAGTTMLLECCAGMQEFASHCYRDMPFVLTPCLWNRFSARFRRSDSLQERAHGDGVLINSDSPEALEEVVWQTFWRKHYQQDRILPWQAEESKDADEFADFFQAHMRKIVYVRRGEGGAARYISKNNLNIARTSLLRKLFPDVVILVPFREPLQHAQSLLKQHRNFLDIHRKDPFASEYMRAIGHYDFGENLRPVDFDDWLDRRESEKADSLGFWLEYWTAAYSHLLDQNDADIHFLDYDAMCAQPERGLRLAAELIRCREPAALLAAASQIHPARSRVAIAGTLPFSTLHEANRIHAALQDRALEASNCLLYQQRLLPAYPASRAAA